MTYTATRNSKGHLVIEGVPIFVECKRGDLNFDAKWLQQAVERARQSEAEGYLPPLHVRHHGDATAKVAPAGYFRIRGVRTLTFKGEPREAIIADLTVTDPGVDEAVLADRLPYRSVEILDTGKPSIDSLALLDHQVPYLELPMLMVSDASAAKSQELAGATFASPWSGEALDVESPVLALFRRGQSALLFTQERPTMDEDEKKPDDAKPEGEAPEAKPEGAAEPKIEAAAIATPDVQQILAAIQSGSISVANLEAIKAAVAAAEGAAGMPTPPNPMMQPATAATPAQVPGEAMSAMKPTELDSRLAALAGENTALRARLDERDAADKRREDIATALRRLDGRPLGANLEAELVKFHTDYGPKAFEAYVAKIATTFAATAVPAGDAAKALLFAGHGGSGTPEVAMSYTDQGADAVNAAARFAAEHAELGRHGIHRMSVEQYVASNMARRGFKVPAKRPA